MHLFIAHATKFAPNRQTQHGPTMAKAGIAPERNPLVCVSPRDAIPRQAEALCDTKAETHKQDLGQETTSGTHTC